ncbi:tRNA (guanine(6)-N2)-methyltransferase THUMP3 isoform X2 [Nematostella vectensis]|nr:tRNA (guanine(6)-N2)-methyltransferase THUMP3 isoform X2 [Nematostella vectensis]
MFVMMADGVKKPENMCELCATVITGLESVAVLECQEKLDFKPVRERGRIYFDISLDSLETAKNLRSIERLFVVVDRIEDFGSTKENSDVLQKFYDLAKQLHWKSALETWKAFTGYQGPVTKTDDDVAKQLSAEEIKSLPSFRVTCSRSGNNHDFKSSDAAAQLGGGLNDLFHWPVNLSNADIEIILNVVDDRVVVGVALTRETQGRRNIEHFGPTTLKSSLAYCLLKLADIKTGDVVCDPMCGGGSIPIEALLNWPLCVHICGDHHELAPSRTLANLSALTSKQNRKLPLDIYQWDVCNLPFKTNSMDVIVTDLPFGKKSGSKQNNWSLYPQALDELARVCPPKTGRAVILTHDKKALAKTLQRMQKWWKVKLTLWVNMGGLQSGVYSLLRTTNSK